MKGLLETLEYNLRRLVAGLSTRRPKFVNRPVHAKFIVDDVVLGKGYTRVLRFLPASTIPPMLRTHSFTCHQCYTFLALDSIVM